ncbi:MAG TPA: AlkA N-terminal domain-containing protein, partial [Candidatus Limnocylindrales bacterium]
MRPLAGMTGQPAAAGPMRVLDDEAVVEAAVARVRADPGAIAGADELAASIGLERDRLDRLAIEYFHRPIDELVELSRVEAAASLLLEGGTPEAVGRLVGFEDEVAFGRAFERRMSVDAKAFAATASGEFELHLPPDYPRSAMLAYLGRDPRSPTERVRGDRYRVALRLRDGPVLVEVVFGPKVARCRLVAGSLPGTDAAVLLHARLRARLGLAIDPASFERHVLARPEIAGLVDGRRGLRIPLVGDLFDAIVWVIAGQQVSLAAAFSMRRRLIDGLGERVLELRLPPTAERIAAVDDEELLGFGFSRAKAHALVHVARAIADGA